jgi:hypothetical protein
LADAKETAEPDADDLGSDSEEIVEVESRDDGPTVVVKKVPCGKDNCSSCSHSPTGITSVATVTASLGITAAPLRWGSREPRGIAVVGVPLMRCATGSDWEE